MSASRNVRVPQEIEAEVAVFVEQLREHAGASESEKDAIRLIKPEVKYLDATTAMIPIALSIPTAVLSSLSKAWIDKYVTPILMKRLQRPSEKFERWLRQTFNIK